MAIRIDPKNEKLYYNKGYKLQITIFRRCSKQLRII